MKLGNVIRLVLFIVLIILLCIAEYFLYRAVATKYIPVVYGFALQTILTLTGVRLGQVDMKRFLTRK